MTTFIKNVKQGLIAAAAKYFNVLEKKVEWRKASLYADDSDTNKRIIAECEKLGKQGFTSIVATIIATDMPHPIGKRKIRTKIKIWGFKPEDGEECGKCLKEGMGLAESVAKIFGGHKIQSIASSVKSNNVFTLVDDIYTMSANMIAIRTICATYIPEDPDDITKD